MNLNKKPTASSRGFTLIELIIVIVILGVLAVTVAPRFIDISDDAEKTTSRAVTVAFQEAVKLSTLKWQVAGQPNSIAIQNHTLNMTSDGFPTPITGDRQGCTDMWNALLDSSITLSDYVATVATEGWTVFGFNGGCAFYNQDGEQLNGAITPFFIYLASTGLVTTYNMD